MAMPFCGNFLVQMENTSDYPILSKFLQGVDDILGYCARNISDYICKRDIIFYVWVLIIRIRVSFLVSSLIITL